MAKKCDLAIIGGGPAGYTAALRASEAGFRVVCIEKDGLGGTCLQRGCIPSKALLHTAHVYHQTLHLKDMGLKAQDVGFSLPAIQKRCLQTIGALEQGIGALFKAAGVEHIKATAQLAGGRSITLQGKGGKTELLADKAIVLASGSVPFMPPQLPKHARLLSSDEALSLDHLPKTLIVVGGGYIGLELGLFWARLGTRVLVIEAAPNLLPSCDDDVRAVLQKELEKAGVTFYLGAAMESAKGTDKAAEIKVLHAGETKVLKADYALLALGRRAATQGLGLQEAGVQTDENGFIIVDDGFQTSQPGIYAVGDAIGGAMLAHKAEKEAEVLMQHLAGQHNVLQYGLIPSVIYTDPQIASVGFSEKELKKQDVPYVSAKAFYAANGRAKAAGYTAGFLKLLAHRTSGRLLGVHVVGEDAETLIDKGVLAMHLGASVFDLVTMVHAHPTLSELYKEAAHSLALKIAK